MSRGPGIWQQAILERIAEGKVVILTGRNHSHAEQNAIRRAARTLEAKGALKIISWPVDGVPRLVACPVDLPTPAQRVVTGLDGKRYQLPMWERATESQDS